MEQTTCCVVGGGPAGMVLALLLARSGVPVTVLEKHGDFLRDFRGDTVHPSTLALLDELGLAGRFAELPQRRVRTVRLPVGTDGAAVTVGDLSVLPGPYNYVAMVPQWDLLDLLADEARREPSFELRTNTEATGFLIESGRVNGVRYRTTDGRTGELRALLTVACDGRGSLARTRPELRLRRFPCPMDAWWFRLPRRESDPQGLYGSAGDRFLTAMIDRGDYWQCAGLIPKGTDTQRRAAGLDRFLADFTAAVPWIGDRAHALRSWDEVKLLDVRLDRLRRWHRPGLLCIGDAAHAMSPIFGIGINLAVQDAVAAARYLTEPLRRGRVDPRDVRRLQRRRRPATVATQTLQRMAHARIIAPILEGRPPLGREKRARRVARLLAEKRWMRRLPAYFIGYGALRERPPDSAVRRPRTGTAAGVTPGKRRD
ncbi:2-polyprenyl-6-methoxyphenol hydroxylase-like FAD-dependent oxidoreductase [Streptomyces puniciscabiei]|uniref:2-polyprenyl-6-methoxyphenol hydroxylase-like FAD-dependent oxidoreductase n=1 Tax=Streptomyces puniciscabiei TaxID=164348 RepID=A0A542SZH0_9ACTN|nr:FAD-dependent oxidoreductase [Streptomyces puniciscabiei]TQK79932.1 2-polyprenyl-6-methoxyphenol hydroxylase-like FAD-dependent oxidoreductase [Streptomyces puniciscabiei]